MEGVQEHEGYCSKERSPGIDAHTDVKRVVCQERVRDWAGGVSYSILEVARNGIDVQNPL